MRDKTRLIGQLHSSFLFSFAMLTFAEDGQYYLYSSSLAITIQSLSTAF